MCEYTETAQAVRDERFSELVASAKETRTVAEAALRSIEALSKAMRDAGIKV